MRITFLFIALTLAVSSCSSQPADRPKPADDRVTAPRIWNDRDLAEWANPVAGLGVRPDHVSESEFYASQPAEWVRTYPVYFPGREPDGYWERLQRLKPEPLITAEARTEDAWITAGQRVFEEMDVPIFRSRDTALIATVRSKDAFEKMGGHPQPDGRVHYLRWVPTSQGLSLGVNDCASCHTRQLPDGTQLNGAQADAQGDGVVGTLVSAGDERFFGEPPAMVAWRSFGVPWVENDIHERLKSMSPEDLGSLTTPPGTFARFNGSPFFPTQIPDLAGIKDRKYIDHTATHVVRGPEDIARYALLVTCCDAGGFGPHKMLTGDQRRVRDRMTDELTFALGKYLFSLEPAKNPQPADRRAEAGKGVFTREDAVAVIHRPSTPTTSCRRSGGSRQPPIIRIAPTSSPSPLAPTPVWR